MQPLLYLVKWFKRLILLEKDLKVLQVEILRKPFFKAKNPVVGSAFFNRRNVIKFIVSIDLEFMINFCRFWRFNTFTLIHRFGIKASNQKSLTTL